MKGKLGTACIIGTVSAALAVAVIGLTVAPAGAGPQLTQGVKAAVRLPVGVPAQQLTLCDEKGCTHRPIIGAITVDTLGLTVRYALLSSNTMPDVASIVGRLVTTDACNGRLGVRIAITGGRIGAMSTAASMNGGPAPVTTTNGTPAQAISRLFRQICV